MTLAAHACGPTDVSRPTSTAPVAVVIVSPAADQLLVGDSQQLFALVKDICTAATAARVAAVLPGHRGPTWAEGKVNLERLPAFALLALAPYQVKDRLLHLVVVPD